VFRGKFIAGLRRAYRRKNLRFHGPIAELEDPKRFASFLRTVFRQDWVVYAKPAFGGPTQVLGNCSRSPRSLNRRAQRPLPRRPVGIAQSAEPRCKSAPTSPLTNSLIDASSSTVPSPPTKLARRRATARRRCRVPLPRNPASNYRSGQSTNASASTRRFAAVLPQASPSGQHALPAVPN
jgi:hypothetical protein